MASAKMKGRQGRSKQLAKLYVLYLGAGPVSSIRSEHPYTDYPSGCSLIAFLQFFNGAEYPLNFEPEPNCFGRRKWDNGYFTPNPISPEHPTPITRTFYYSFIQQENISPRNRISQSSNPYQHFATSLYPVQHEAKTRSVRSNPGAALPIPTPIQSVSAESCYGCFIFWSLWIFKK